MAVSIGRLNLVDKSTLVYNAIVVVIIILFSSRIPSWHWIVLVNLGTIAAILLFFSQITEESHGLLRLLRNFYPVLFFFAGYEQTGRMNRIFFSEFLDPWFQGIEYRIFGLQPAVVLAERFPQWWLNEYMHLAYFSYYLLFPSLGLIFYLRRDRRLFQNYMLTLCNSFYVYFLTYIALPVEGATSFGTAGTASGGPFTEIMKVIYDHFEPPGAAFPSSHVGIAVLVLIYAFRYLPRGVSSVYAVFCVSLTISTVYCRYHYAIDVIAGLVTGVFLTAFWRRVFASLAG
jgi:membrane-associated phospholipid phosphatase